MDDRCRLAWVVLAAGLMTACTGAQNGASPEVYSFALTVSSVGALPKCAAATAGTTAFVQTPPALYSCQASAWLPIPCASIGAGAVAYSSATQTLLACVSGHWTPVALPQGPTGAQGQTGAQGAKGDTGMQGAKGDTGAQGAKGDTGAQGAKGDTGMQGAKGDSGAPTLVSVTAIPAGAICPAGGEEISFGVDADGDGTLDADEVRPSATVHVCDGANAGATNPPVCTAGSYRCDGQQPQQCAAGGDWSAAGASCDALGKACVRGTCVGECVPGRTECAGTGIVRTCTSEGAWATSRCPNLCEAGQCAAAPTALASGYGTSCVVVNGAVECWGDNVYGQLGNGTTNSSFVPGPVSGLAGASRLTGVSSVSANFEAACAVLLDGTVACWGSNADGQLGDPTLSPGALTPARVPGLSGVSAISVGGDSVCALLGDGTVRCWGNNSRGQLGNGTSIPSLVPTTVGGLAGAVAVSVGVSSACAVLSTGSVMCWGDDASGQLGNGSTGKSTVPVPVSQLSNAIAVSVGARAACAVLQTGAVECWGTNEQGQLGNGSTSSSLLPVITGVNGATTVGVGVEASCALVTDGKVLCWGNNNLGQLGTPPAGQSSLPTLVPGVSGAVALSVGAAHACALTTDGSVQCWGSNSLGQLGVGAPGVPRSPTTIVF